MIKVVIAMKKYEMKDFLFELLNEHDSQFSDISLDGALDALIVNTIDGKSPFFGSSSCSSAIINKFDNTVRCAV